MPKFFITKEQIENNTVTLFGDDARHISYSLRMAVGEHITVSDEFGMEYDCVLERFSEREVGARICTSRRSLAEPEVRVILYQALPKGEKLDLIIQKSVECGVCRITPFESERCIAKSKNDNEARKTERRNKIALEAAKQSGRGIVPVVTQTVTFEQMLKEASACDAAVFCYEGEGTEPIGRILKDLRDKGVDSIAVIVGSEGGFSPAEAERAKGIGCVSAGLGKRILRAETAAIFALSCIVYEFELS